MYVSVGGHVCVFVSVGGYVCVYVSVGGYVPIMYVRTYVHTCVCVGAGG